MNFILLILFAAFGAFAQDSDVSYLETQNTIGSPFSIPISVNEKGEFHILNDSGIISIGPLGQYSLTMAKVQYVLPVRQDAFSFMEQDKDLRWVEIKRRRFEIGLGLRALLAQNIVSVGLIPYKGSYHVMMRTKNGPKVKTARVSLPNELEMIKEWEIGDQGSFQTYGGIQASAGVGLSYFSLLDLSFVIQNQFIIGIRKINKEQIILSVGEENLKRRMISSGAAVASASFTSNDGKLFTSSFVLTMNNPEHQQLYARALKGKLIELQAALPSNLQKTFWKGTEKSLYVGIPWVIGKTIRVGHFDIDDNGMDEDLDIQTRRNNGELLPLRNHKRMIYQTDKNIILFWASEMKRTHFPTLERNFLSLGRTIGINGFESEIPKDTNFGSTVTHLGLSFSREEISRMTSIDINDLAFHLKAKCEEQNLKCAKERVMKQILADLKKYLQEEWVELRHDLGKLLGKHPALIHALVKSMKLEKKVYFKFLSEKYQSIEGTTTIDL